MVILLNGGGRCEFLPTTFRKNSTSQGALRRSEGFRGVRMRTQTWQRHHGLLESPPEKDERGDNVDAGAAGESSGPRSCCQETLTLLRDAPERAGRVRLFSGRAGNLHISLLQRVSLACELQEGRCCRNLVLR